MAEKSGFFDSQNGDRRYSADFIADFYGQILTSGILNGGINLQVTNSNNDMQSDIAVGRAFINGYFYQNDAVVSLTHSTAHALLDRIDRIVLRLDTNEAVRSVKARIVEGTPADTPVVPSITRDGSIYEISLAQVVIPHGSSVIPSANITDERLNADVCGLINSLITVDTETFQQQFDEFMESLEGATYVTQSNLDDIAGVGRTTETVKENHDKIEILDKDYTKLIPYGGTTTNTGNAYVIATPAISALTTGMGISVKINADSTGASTLNWDGKGAINIKKPNGLAAANLKANSIYTLRYNGTNFILQGEGTSGNAIASDLLLGKTAGVDAGDITGTLALIGTALISDVANTKTFYNTDAKTILTGISNARKYATGSYSYEIPKFTTQNIVGTGLAFTPKFIFFANNQTGLNPFWAGVYHDGSISGLQAKNEKMGFMGGNTTEGIEITNVAITSSSFAFTLSNSVNNYTIAGAGTWIAFE